jgi:hypothetical protein
MRASDTGHEPDAPLLEPGGSRALVPIETAPPRARPCAGRHPEAPFLAHLIAVNRGVPQMRTRRRASPADAVATYAATLAAAPPRIGVTLRRSA